jgi:hypothetical protein
MRCPHCQHDNREGRRFCAECGAPLAYARPDGGSTWMPRRTTIELCPMHPRQLWLRLILWALVAWAPQPVTASPALLQDIAPIRAQVDPYLLTLTERWATGGRLARRSQHALAATRRTDQPPSCVRRSVASVPCPESADEPLAGPARILGADRHPLGTPEAMRSIDTRRGCDGGSPGPPPTKPASFSSGSGVWRRRRAMTE